MGRPEDEARRLLREHDVTKAPTPVADIAAVLGAEINETPFEGDMSGVLMRTEGRIVIAVNRTQAHVRRRFTIAHEIGHLVLHRGRPVIIDKLVRINLRDGRASLASDAEEIEANAFAAELLMPEDQMRAAVERLLPTIHRHDQSTLAQVMSSEFEVSHQAMEYRLVNLGIDLPT